MELKKILLNELQQQYFNEVILPTMISAGWYFKNDVFYKHSTIGLVKNGIRRREIIGFQRGNKVVASFYIQRYKSKITKIDVTSDLLPFDKFTKIDPKVYENVNLIYQSAKQQPESEKITLAQLHQAYQMYYKTNLKFSTFCSLLSDIKEKEKYGNKLTNGSE